MSNVDIGRLRTSFLPEGGNLTNVVRTLGARAHRRYARAHVRTTHKYSRRASPLRLFFDDTSPEQQKYEH